MTGCPAPSSRRSSAGRAHCPRRTRPVRVQPQPGDRLREPSVEVVPGVGEPEGDDPTVVVLELPEDVTGAEPAGDEQDQLLRQWSLGTNHAGVGQQTCQGGRIGIRPTPQDPAGVDHRPGMILVPGGPDQLGPGGGVPLAGGGHPYPDACLELLLRGHIETFRPQPDARLHASNVAATELEDVRIGWLSWRLPRSPLLPHRRAAWRLGQGVRRRTRRTSKTRGLDPAKPEF